MLVPNQNRRRGATAVETAIVASVTFLIIIGLIVGGWAVFRYEQLNCMAQEGARYASVHGGDYQQDTSLNSPTTQQIINTAILPYSTGMDPNAIAVTVQWIDNGSNTTTNWDTASKNVHSINANGEYVNNSIAVTINYSWSPGVWGLTYAMQSVCVMPLTY